MIYDYANARFDFVTSNGIEFDLQLRPRITIVHGETATGKSFLVSELVQAKKSFKEIGLDDLNNVIIYDSNFPADTESLVIIDRGDLAITEGVRKAILESKYLHFLIFMRKPVALHLTPNYYGSFEKTGNVVKISYQFSERSWFI